MTITGSLILFGGGLALTIATGYGFTRKRMRRSIYGAGLFLCLGILFLHYGLFFSNKLLHLPIFIFGHGPALGFLGPLLYFFFQPDSPQARSRKSNLLLHFIPGMVLLIFFGPFYFLPSAAKVAVYTGQDSASIYTDIAQFDYHLLILSIYLLFYTAMALQKIAGVLIDFRHQSELKAVLVTLGLTGVAIMLAALSWFLNVESLLKGTYTLGTFIILSLSILSRRYPNFLEELILKAEQNHSRLGQVDTDAALRQLTLLMEEDRLYCDEDLSLARLASNLGIAAAQLSELINRNFNCNFNSYINSYRIAEAQKMLESTDQTVLDVALHVGFNSSSVFHTVFKRKTGFTPGAYRRQHRSQAASQHTP